MDTIWHRLICGSLDPLLQAAAEVDPTHPASVQSLRQHGSREEVAVVLSLLEARRRASGRLEDHDHLWLTVDSAQQATRTSVARHKAQRFRSVLGDGPVIDLCCGIGSDAMALAEGGAVILVDRHPLRLELARANLERTNSPAWALCADACALPLPALPLHIDPDRREGSRRRHRYDQLVPAPGVLEDLMNRHVDMALKCGPGVDSENLPPGEVEFIQDRGDLVEATLWRGKLDGSVARRATLLPSGETISGDPATIEPYPDENPPWIHEPVAAVERAGLLSQLQGRFAIGELHPGLGWLAGDRALDTPWLRSFEVIERIPWREDKVRRWLRARGEGLASIKTRGVSEDPGALLKSFGGAGGELTLALLRHGRKRVAWILKEAGRGTAGDSDSI